MKRWFLQYIRITYFDSDLSAYHLLPFLSYLPILSTSFRAMQIESSRCRVWHSPCAMQGKLLPDLKLDPYSMVVG